ncbi:hypothetical protein ACSFA0_13255 [Variovorax sp. LT1P1]|uniref:hypothetical protein n=1 Tax=Variovorax sp. LT1P1 TaxID=3443730 RepID=UPI003F44ACEF
MPDAANGVEGAGATAAPSDEALLGGGTDCSKGAAARASLADWLVVPIGGTKRLGELGRLKYQSRNPPCKVVRASSSHSTETSMPAGRVGHRRRDFSAGRASALAVGIVGGCRAASKPSASRRVESNALAGV